MIISHKFQCIYIKLDKVASTSFEKALQQCGGGKANIWLGHKCNPHISARKIKELIPKDIWDNYLKVATIRCPYDMLISQYYWKHHYWEHHYWEHHYWEHPRHPKDFTQFIAKESNIYLASYNATKTFAHIYGLHETKAEQSTGVKRLLTDFLIRYEHLDEDIKELEIKINCPGLLDTFQSFTARGGIRPKIGTAAYEMYSKYPAAKAIVDERCKEAAKEYEFFGRYWPAYKARLEDAMKAHGACSG